MRQQSEDFVMTRVGRKPDRRGAVASWRRVPSRSRPSPTRGTAPPGFVPIPYRAVSGTVARPSSTASVHLQQYRSVLVVRPESAAARYSFARRLASSVPAPACSACGRRGYAPCTGRPPPWSAGPRGSAPSTGAPGRVGRVIDLLGDVVGGEWMPIRLLLCVSIPSTIAVCTKSGHHRDHPDSVASPFQLQCLGESAHRKLGGRVGGQFGLAVDRRAEHRLTTWAPCVSRR